MRTTVKERDKTLPSELPAASFFSRSIDQFALHQLAKMAGGEDEFDRDRVEKLMDAARAYAADLAGPTPTPLERSLCESIALTWFALRWYEGCTYIEAQGESIRLAEWKARRLDAAARRHLQTVKMLATVRKLAIPNLVQVNVAAQHAAVLARGG